MKLRKMFMNPQVPLLAYEACATHRQPAEIPVVVGPVNFGAARGYQPLVQADQA